jgi:acetamidase/formamidase
MVAQGWKTCSKDLTGRDCKGGLQKNLSYLGSVLQAKLHLSFEEAIMLMSTAANVGICQTVNLFVTTKACISKSMLKLE